MARGRELERFDSLECLLLDPSAPHLSPLLSPHSRTALMSLPNLKPSSGSHYADNPNYRDQVPA